MSTPSIKVGQGNWGIKAGNLLGYANTEKKFSPVEFTSTRALNTATRVNPSGNIEIVNANVPRIDYFGGQASLLVEPSAQNLALQSENFSTTWSTVGLLAFGIGSVLNTTATLDPYGTNFADLIVANTTLQQHRVDQTTVSVSGSYTFSVFLKTAGYDFGRLRIGSAGGTFNLVSGTISSSDVGIIASIQSYGNGWYRCIISKAASSANEIVRINMLPTATFADFAGDGTSGIYVFGAQYETGSVATSYIPTTTGTVTRSADVISVTGVAGLIGQTEGTMYAEVDLRNSAVTAIFAIDDGDTSDFISIIRLANFTIRVQIRRLGASIASIITSSPVALGTHKIALAYKNADYALYIDGVSAGTSANSTDYPATALTQCVLSNASYGPLNDRIRAASIYQTRLPNTTTDGSPSLQSITTL
jgi:hypothetical protein